MKNHEKERLYEKILSPYVPIKLFTLHFINSNTLESELIYLCDVIKSNNHFVFDTELDINEYVPAIIQLLVMSTNSSASFMLLIETCFLPIPSSSCFDLIKQLFRHVFSNTNYLYSWGGLPSELRKFEHYQLFPSSMLSKFIDVQALFTKWFDSFLMNNMVSAVAANIVDDAVVVNATESVVELFVSASEMNRIKITKNQLWSLQDGVAYILHKYLSKRNTCRSWAIGLDTRLPSRNKNYSYNYRQRLIVYASNDCLSLMELIWFIYEQYIIHPSCTENYIYPLGEYFSYLKQKFTSEIPFSISSLVKNQPQWSASLFSDTDDDSDDMLTVHESDERQQSLVDPSTQLSTTVVCSSSEKAATTDILSDEGIIVNNHLSIDQQFNTKSQVIMSTLIDVNQHSIVQINQLQTKQKPRRSMKARKRRNQQTSLRHRRNRYRFELQRSINIDISTVKNILREYNIDYTNINPVQSVVFIGVKSQQQQQLYDQVLPVDIFVRT